MLVHTTGVAVTSLVIGAVLLALFGLIWKNRDILGIPLSRALGVLALAAGLVSFGVGTPYFT